MRIFYVANARLPSEKAHPYQILKMCEAFEKNGMDVELVLPFRVQTTKKLKQIQNIWKYYGINNKFKITKLPSFDLIWLDPYIGTFPLHLRFPLQANSFAIFATICSLFKKADVYYTRDRYFALFFGFLKFVHKRKIYYEAHKYEPFISRLMKKGKIDGLIVITHKLKELYMKEGIPEKKIFVAPDGVDLKMFDNPSSKADARKELGLPQGSILIGYVGQLHTMGMEKGIDDLIKALKIIKGQRGEVIICLVGGPEEMFTKYQEIAKKEALKEQDIIFVDRVPPPKLPLYMNAFDVCAMPFPWTEHYAYYMSPLKLFEYMASKRPIVATDLPSVREILNAENAVLAEPGDHEALAEGLKKVFNDEEFAKRIAEKAYEDVQEYTWEKRAERILEFIGKKL